MNPLYIAVAVAAILVAVATVTTKDQPGGGKRRNVLDPCAAAAVHARDGGLKNATDRDGRLFSSRAEEADALAVKGMCAEFSEAVAKAMDEDFAGESSSEAIETRGNDPCFPYGALSPCLRRSRFPIACGNSGEVALHNGICAMTDETAPYVAGAAKDDAKDDDSEDDDNEDDDGGEDGGEFVKSVPSVGAEEFWGKHVRQPPYLTGNPPPLPVPESWHQSDVVDVTVGRQLLVDDFAVQTEPSESLRGAALSSLCNGGRADGARIPRSCGNGGAQGADWSRPASRRFHTARRSTVAVDEPFRNPGIVDGVYWEPRERKYVMLTQCDDAVKKVLGPSRTTIDARWHGAVTCVTRSDDGISWGPLERLPGLDGAHPRQGAVLHRDDADPNPDRRYKYFLWLSSYNDDGYREAVARGPNAVRAFGDIPINIVTFTSPNLRAGTWTAGPNAGTAYDCSAPFLDPFRGRFAFGLKESWVNLHRFYRFFAVPHAAMLREFDRCPAGPHDLDDPRGQLCGTRYRKKSRAMRSTWDKYFVKCSVKHRKMDPSEDVVRSYRPCFHLPRRSGVPWLRADSGDPAYDDSDDVDPNLGGRRFTDLYTFAPVPYESIILNLVGVHWRSDAYPKDIDFYASWSRDGFHFDRVQRATVGSDDEPSGQRARVVELDEDHTYSIITGPSVALSRSGDSLLIYVGARSKARIAEGIERRSDFYRRRGGKRRVRKELGDDEVETLVYSLRRDGFASLSPPALAAGAGGDAAIGGPASSLVFSRPLVWSFMRLQPTALFVNVRLATAEDAITALVSDPAARGGAFVRSVTLRGPLDATRIAFRWSADARTSRAGAAPATGLDPATVMPLGEESSVPLLPVRLTFALEGTGTELYSFWVSATRRGESRGPVAGGGEGMASGSWDV